MNYTIDVPAVQAVLMAIAAEGTALNAAAGAAKAAGDEAAAGFGTAAEVAEAFAGFWNQRDDVAQRVSSLVYRKADSVSDAVQAFVAADWEMTQSAERALTAISTSYTAPVPGRKPMTAVE